MVVSSTSMKVGTTTATATIQGLIAGRGTAPGDTAMLLMTPAPGKEGIEAAYGFVTVGPMGGDSIGLWDVGVVGPWGSGEKPCSTLPALGTLSSTGSL